MCGIFGLVLKNEYDVQSDVKDKYAIKKHFKYGESVVRNIQVLKTLIHNYMGISSPLYQRIR